MARTAHISLAQPGEVNHVRTQSADEVQIRLNDDAWSVNALAELFGRPTPPMAVQNQPGP